MGGGWGPPRGAPRHLSPPPPPPAPARPHDAPPALPTTAAPARPLAPAPGPRPVDGPRDLVADRAEVVLAARRPRPSTVVALTPGARGALP